MKLAWLSDTLEQNNGIATYLQETLPLVSKKVDVTLYTGRVTKKYDFKTVSMHYQKYPLMKNYDIITPPFPKIEADVIHAHTPYSTGLHAVKLKIKKVITAHFLPYHFLEWAFGSNQPKAFRDAIWKYEIWLLNKFDKVICQTHAGKKLFRSKGLRKPVEVIANGINLKNYSGNAERFRKKYGIKDEFGLFIGRLDASKQPKWIINIAKSYPERKFIISGTGTMGKELKKAAPNNIKFYGRFDSRQDLLDCYAACSALMMPSLVETEGLVAQEAMAVGAPVLISDLDILMEVVGKGGAACKNSKEMGERMEQIFDSNELQNEMSAKANIEVKKRDINISVEKLVKLYESLL